MDTDIIMDLLVGTSEIEKIIVEFFYAMVGSFLSLLLNSTTRDVSNKRTPIQFSYIFLFKDNSKRIFTSLLLIIVFIRFTQELVGVETTIYLSFIIGFCSDKLSNYLKLIKHNLFRDGKDNSLNQKDSNISSGLIETALKIEQGDDINVRVTQNKSMSSEDGSIEIKTTVNEFKQIKE